VLDRRVAGRMERVVSECASGPVEPDPGGCSELAEVRVLAAVSPALLAESADRPPDIRAYGERQRPEQPWVAVSQGLALRRAGACRMGVGELAESVEVVAVRWWRRQLRDRSAEQSRCPVLARAVDVTLRLGRAGRHRRSRRLEQAQARDLDLHHQQGRHPAN